MQQLPLSLPFEAAMGADDFLVTPSNRDAAAWIDKWPHWPSHGLIVSGEAGSGKTHLLSLWLAKSGGRFLSAEELCAQDIPALAGPKNLVALDDAGDVAGQPDAEEKLFHLYNYLKTVSGSLLLTMKAPAAQAGFTLPDLRSRLLTLPVAALGAPDDALLSALIVKQFRDRQIALDTGVVDYLAARTRRDAAGIRSMVEKLDRAALAQGRKVGIALARSILEGQDG